MSASAALRALPWPSERTAVFRIEYVSNLADPLSICWQYLSPALDIATAEEFARRGLALAAERFGAVGFFIRGATGAMLLGSG
jgi:hypothetical protein